MKNILIHGLALPDSQLKLLDTILRKLEKENCLFSFTADFAAKNKKLGVENISSSQNDSLEIVLSLGGDGTFLDSLSHVGKKQTPILGINMGKLGFLASVSKEFINESFDNLFEGRFNIENRTLLKLEGFHENLFEGNAFALNECAVLRRNTSSMIKISCSLNDQFLNTYWADGLMIATPTGSTGYSLSCGGPIMTPDTKNFVITPISPHNLNVRPLIISDDATIKLHIEKPNTEHLISLDSRNRIIESGEGITIKKAPFYAKIIQIEGFNFLNTIRTKLNWGLDQRN